MPIHVLPPDVSSKIAAGEVTERPASVVKELVENSLDAGATEISVELRGGGVDLIRVVDNGVGISADEAELAFERFATSKLEDPSDLGAIATLGFRGEALPSIGAVAHVTMVTRPPAETSGTRVEVSGGRVVDNSPEGAPPGTSITVRQLFRDVPARRKFLRSASAEANRAQALVSRYALSYPAVRFSLRVEDSEALASTGSGDAREAVAAVYGADVAEAMLELVPPGPPEGGRAGVDLAGQPQPGHHLRQRPLGPEPDAELRAAGGLPWLLAGAPLPGRRGRDRAAVWRRRRKRASGQVGGALQARGVGLRRAAAGRPADFDGPLARA